MIIKDLNNFDFNNTRNIIFDWGGVIINIDYNSTVEAFNKHQAKLDFADFYTKKNQRPVFDDFEKGVISPAKFRDAIRSEFCATLSDEEIDTAWSAMLLDTPPERIELLKELSKNHRIFLLSNTNLIHENRIVGKLNTDLGFEFFSLFEKVYLSHHIGMRKPNENIFEYVIQDNKLDKSETLFIDDSIQHIQGASQTNIPSLHLNATMDIRTIFN